MVDGNPAFLRLPDLHDIFLEVPGHVPADRIPENAIDEEEGCGKRSWCHMLLYLRRDKQSLLQRTVQMTTRCNRYDSRGWGLRLSRLWLGGAG
jgi:hypothetical protein